jgi:hypothetical protein
VEFDISFNCHCLLRLATGREIVLDKYTQSRTYSGLLEGTPNKRSNDDTIQWALEDARQDSDVLGAPYLIEPERRDYLREQGDMQFVIDRQHDRPEIMRHIPEWLPQIECVGIFHSFRPARDTTKDASSLTIVWYQDDFGFDSGAVDQLRMVDWDRYATDWEY